MPGPPRPGEPAPPFRLEAANGETVSSDALRGRPVVLFFFPKASTPG
jgi:peroxiredoxin Q/BCP